MDRNWVILYSFLEMYILYSFLLLFSLLFYIPVYYVRYKIIKRENLHLCERLGLRYPKKISGEVILWIHAVSLGEALSLQKFVKRIKAEHPNWVIYFSSLTFTGKNIALEKLKDVDQVFYIPFDFYFIVNKFFKIIEPDFFVLVESEFWPNLLRCAKKYSKRVFLINGRISNQSHKRYSRLKFLIKKILKYIDFYLVQTDVDRKRFLDIGVKRESLEVAGNLKTEVELPLFSEKQVKELRDDLNIPSFVKVVIAGSTRKGEDEQLLNTYAKALKKKEDLAFIIAPRHPERADEIVKICNNLKLPVKKRTGIKKGDKWKVLILDTIGELSFFYTVADVAFIGGSLVPWGGQNFLEPAFYSKPIFFGPHMDNFAYLAELFVRKGAAKIMTGKNDLLEMFLFGGRYNLREMGFAAKETLISLHGATDRVMKLIEDSIKALNGRIR